MNRGLVTALLASSVRIATASAAPPAAPPRSPLGLASALAPGSNHQPLREPPRGFARSAVRQAAGPAIGTHATTGLIVSITATGLVISRAARPSITFLLTPGTYLDPGLGAGIEVSVRYRLEGHTLVATAVTVRHRGSE